MLVQVTARYVIVEGRTGHQFWLCCSVSWQKKRTLLNFCRTPELIVTPLVYVKAASVLFQPADCLCLSPLISSIRITLFGHLKMTDNSFPVALDFSRQHGCSLYLLTFVNGVLPRCGG